MSEDLYEYREPDGPMSVTLKHRPMGNTYDAPEGADWWECPLCPRQRCNRAYDGFIGTYQALRSHLSESHNVGITEQTVTVTLNRIFSDTSGGVIRYVDDRAPVHLAKAAG